MESIQIKENLELRQKNKIHKKDKIKVIRESQFKKLYKALDYLKGHSVVFESTKGVQIYIPVNNFDYNLKKNINKEIILDFDNIEEEFVAGIFVKLNDIYDIDIDDNEEWILSGEMVEYEAENIIITLWNNSSLRISLEW